MSEAKRFSKGLDVTGFTVTLLLPIFLTHGRLLAEASMDVLAVGLLLRSAGGQGWHWARQWWFKAALLWWGWQFFCSLPMIGPGLPQALVQAGLAIRFPLMVVALQSWTLATPSARRRMRWILVACGLYFALQFVAQAATGYNFFGIPRYIDGTLTGPYTHPRAAAPFSRLVLPLLMLGCQGLWGRVGASDASSDPRGAWTLTRLGALAAMSALAVCSVALVALAGQRMPMALTLLGLGVCAVLYRPFRGVALLTLLSVPLLIFALSVFSPPSFHHLILRAQVQLSHFWASPYGLIFTRAVVIAKAHPWTGFGYDAFRHACRDPSYQHGLAWMSAAPGGGGTAICVQHAHNHYLQALTNGGLPGLGFFCAFVVSTLSALWPLKGAVRLRGRRLDDAREPLAQAWCVGLFSAFLIQEWPLASSSDFLNLPLGGWAFMLVGVGLAEARAWQLRAKAACSDTA